MNMGQYSKFSEIQNHKIIMNRPSHLKRDTKWLISHGSIWAISAHLDTKKVLPH